MPYYVLGYNGGIVERNKAIFKAAGLSEGAARATTPGHDAAAAIAVDGKIIAAAAEERFNRKKATFEFPINAINFCLKEAGININQLDCIAHSWVGELLESSMHLAQDDYWNKIYEGAFSVDAKKSILREHFGDFNPDGKFCQVPHHMAHAASAFYASGFNESLVLIIDGSGELETTSVFHGRDGHLRTLDKHYSNGSIAILYGVMTSYLGFDFNSDEYKVMGLSPYGNPSNYYEKMRDLVRLKPGSFEISGNVATGKIHEEGLANFDFLEAMFGPRRRPKERLEQRHMDISAALQLVFQETLIHLCEYYKEKYGLENLCLAGGAALNCSANGIVQRRKLFKNIYVCPASGDDGTALGAALYVSHKRGKIAQADKLNIPFLGPQYCDSDIEAAILEENLPIYKKAKNMDKLCDLVSSYIAEGSIIGWFQGRMEFGPRALGARSILADPTQQDMRDRVNALIKKREDFRPFAPAVLEEKAEEYFEIVDANDLYPLMLSVTNVHEKYHEALPAITHVNGTARVQTVNKQLNPLFWSLIHSFSEKSGFPVLLNTSFNVAGEPIVCSPSDAIKTFRKAGLDYLVMGNFILRKEQT